MTAEEIRDCDVYDVNYEAVQLHFLREIAAQLAELNAALKPALTPTLTFDGNAEWQPPKGPTLPDPGTSYRRRK